MAASINLDFDLRRRRDVVPRRRIELIRRWIGVKELLESPVAGPEGAAGA